MAKPEDQEPVPQATELIVLTAQDIEKDSDEEAVSVDVELAEHMSPSLWQSAKITGKCNPVACSAGYQQFCVEPSNAA